MKKVIKIELIKLMYNTSFWVMFAVYAFLFYMMTNNFSFFLNNATLTIQTEGDIAANIPQMINSVFAFPDVWRNLAYMASYLNPIPAIIIIMIICNEYRFKTFKQQVINGLDPKSLVLGKFSVVAILTIASMLFLFVSTLLVGKSNASISGNEQLSILSGMEAVLLYGLELMGYLSLAMLFAFVVKKTAESILLFFAWTIILQRLAGWALGDIGNFFPSGVFRELNTFPFWKYFSPEKMSFVEPWEIGISVLYILLFALASVFYMNTRDLK
ncbi:ABC transporter permease [Aureibacter tunicatorum]|uniref:Uncharacterized protein n=1 Tax=Aureibacter tunicatorum TaxID=866807 RepID=A0AAE3XKW1_9BACT|nr:ABC transporter permease [Aureibacter tunicatorum]MDR6237616.1 hypothetical protein [Aureibacter tunicatorum]BDD02651.1 hypothetical protein AUTU_01340 [Aureibacter tunicatorum]